MKYAAMLLLLVSSMGAHSEGLAGREAPAFTLMSRDGEQVSLAQYKGKIVYLDFWASWCGPCRKSFPWMNDLHAKLAARGLQVVGVNLDERTDDATRFLKDTPAKFSVLFDPKGSTAVQYQLKGMPSSLLIGRDGKVIHEHSGFNDTDRVELEKKIQAALESK